MKERLVKGRHVRGIIELLETQGRLQTLPELAPPGADLVRKPVYPTTWYQLRAFDDLLQSVHRYVFDGSEVAGQNMGRMLADKYFATLKGGVTVDPDPRAAGQLLARYWSAHFNFGAVDVGACEHGGVAGVRVRITGFPDMSACHGHLIMGWTAAALERCAPGKSAHLRVEERPWMHNSVLTYSLTPE